MAAATFTAIIEPDEDGFHAYVPALPGCHTFGHTIEEAKANIVEAAELYIEAVSADGEEIPSDTSSQTPLRLTIQIASQER